MRHVRVAEHARERAVAHVADAVVPEIKMRHECHMKPRRESVRAGIADTVLAARERGNDARGVNGHAEVRLMGRVLA